MPTSPRISYLRDVFMPICTGISTLALGAVASFLWSMNATMATVLLTQQHQGDQIHVLFTQIEGLRNDSIKTQLDVTRVESQCMMWIENSRKSKRENQGDD